ncbi:MAG: c-type cytochrome [Candidatus Koribacter versatilis]|nr:c-type cytochrome [Candidatus Koribacter versatilis]
MFKSLLIVSASLFVAICGAQTTKPTPKTAYHPVPVADARQANPVKSTPESLESGKKIYAYDCASCHGATGDGKTDVAKDMKLPDLTDPAALKDRTDGEIFYVIKNGRGDMPPEGDRVKSDQLWKSGQLHPLARQKESSRREAIKLGRLPATHH